MPEAEAEDARGGAYGERLGGCFGLEASAFVSRTITNAQIAVTQIRCDVRDNGMTAPIPSEDAFLLTLQLRACARHDLWIEGRPQRTGSLQLGSISIYDLRCDPIVNSISPFHNLHFYLPRTTLNTIAEQDDLLPVDELANDPGIGVQDQVIAGLGMSLVPAFDKPSEVTRIFVDHIAASVASYAAQTYGRRSSSPRRFHSKLSSAQERIAKDMLSASLNGDITIGELAKACGLTISQFRRGFQRSTGTLPHLWLLNRRIDRAKVLLRSTRKTFEEIAAESGFVDARHMRRVFEQALGVAPLQFRSV